MQTTRIIETTGFVFIPFGCAKVLVPKCLRFEMINDSEGHVFQPGFNLGNPQFACGILLSVPYKSVRNPLLSYIKLRTISPYEHGCG